MLARRQSFDAADALVREAVAIGESSDFLLAQADALMDLAEVLRLAGRTEEAISALEQAICRHEQKGNISAVVRARTELEGLTRSV